MNKEQIEKELEAKYAELQMIGQQMKQLQKQIVMLNTQILELAQLQLNLTELKDIKPGTSIKITIGNGIYTNAELKNSQELLVNIGAGVVVKKDVDSAKKLIEEQEKEIKQVHEQMMAELKNLYQHANSMDEEMAKLAKQMG